MNLNSAVENVTTRLSSSSSVYRWHRFPPGYASLCLIIIQPRHQNLGRSH